MQRIVQFFGQGASVATLSWQQWLISVGIAAITLPMGLVVKSLPVPEKGAWKLYQEGLADKAEGYLEKRVT